MPAFSRNYAVTSLTESREVRLQKIGSEKHIDSLDGLRGVAILLVFFFHYLPRNLHNPFSYIASIGWAGVDLFFVLSGFLITGILYDTRESGNYFKVFYIRRALRLLPVYCLAVSIVLLVGTLVHSPRHWMEIPFFIYCANIVIPIAGSVGDVPPYLACTHFWSLALEEQFYSFWPLIVFLVAKRRTLIHICIGCMVVAPVIRVVLIALHFDIWSVVYSQLPTRMDSLMAGALLALVVRGPERERWLQPVKLWWILAAFCAGLFLVLVKARTFFLTSIPMSSLGYTMLAGISVCVLAMALLPGTTANRVGRNPVLRFFGRYSYGLYLWHGLAGPLCNSWLGAFRERIQPQILADFIYTFSMLALFTGIAVFSYQLLEIQFLKLKSRFRYAPAAAQGASQQDPLPSL